MDYKLSEGSLEIIMRGGTYDKPVMQMIGSKRIQGSGANERFRLLISDGKHSHSFAMLGTQLNDRLITGELSDFSVIRIDKFMTSFLKQTDKGEKRVIIVLDMTILVPGSKVGKKIGNPQNLPEESQSCPSLVKPLPKPAPAVNMPSYMDNSSANLDSSMLNSQMTHPISSLSPYQNKWVIKARVMNKSAIRSWSNAKGEGKLFSMDLCDESGEIRATAFKNECDKFYDMIQVDKVYFISRCTLKTANKQFSTLKNDYEMTFTANTIVAECTDDAGSMPTVKFDFVPISDIANKSANTLLDIVGVCKMASDVQELTAKTTGKLLKKREATLVDTTGVVILTLWGNEAENFDASTTPVVAIKGARIAEFNGSKSLSCLAGTLVRLNPDLPEVHRLRGWYDNGGANADLVNVSAREAGALGGGGGEWLTFSEAAERRLGSGDKGDYYNLLGVITYTFPDNAIYKACAQDGCNKKLVDQENGSYRCEKCNRESTNFKYRLLLSANVSDPTGDERVTAFNEAAEAMLGKPVAEIGQLFEYDKNGYTQLFEELKFQRFVFRFRTKMETYSDEARLKTTVINAQPIDYKEANARLIKMIKALSGVEI